MAQCIDIIFRMMKGTGHHLESGACAWVSWMRHHLERSRHRNQLGELGDNVARFSEPDAYLIYNLKRGGLLNIGKDSPTTNVEP